jgi:coenzyme Q-binding protein COQ10
MPSASIKKEILCSKENLIKVVLDIENYPKFVPWCVGSKIHKKTVTLDKIEIVADLTIGKSFIN